MREIKRYNFLFTKKVSHIMGNVVNNNVISLYGDRWQLNLW